MSKIKKNRYQQIFDELLPDLNGYISKETVYKSNLSDSIKKIIKPLIDELEELEEILDFNEFYNAMENLMKILSPAEKNILLQTSKSKPKPEIFEFTPKTNYSASSQNSPIKIAHKRIFLSNITSI